MIVKVVYQRNIYRKAHGFGKSDLTIKPFEIIDGKKQAQVQKNGKNPSVAKVVEGGGGSGGLPGCLVRAAQCENALKSRPSFTGPTPAGLFSLPSGPYNELEWTFSQRPLSDRPLEVQ